MNPSRNSVSATARLGPQRRDLLFAKEGCLFRQAIQKNKLTSPTLLANFNSLTYTGVLAPPLAHQWPRS